MGKNTIIGVDLGYMEGMFHIVRSGCLLQMRRDKGFLDLKNRCQCKKRYCSCAGGLHSYATHYSEIIDRYRPSIVVEWGPGLNTELALATPIKQVVSVEHQEKYIYRGTDQRCSQRLVQVDSFEYISPREISEADLFFVDGRRRAECLIQIFKKAKPGAIVCVHDAQRARYIPALQLFDNVKFPRFGFAVGMQRGAPS